MFTMINIGNHSDDTVGAVLININKMLSQHLGADQPNDTDSSEISMEESTNRKRPCDEDLKETYLENTEKKENVENAEEPDSLANKKPRSVDDIYR